MPTNGMTIDSLNTVSSLTAQDEVPVWDKEASGEPTRKITAQNMANSVKSLASLPNTTEMNTAIAQSTADVIRTGDVVNNLTSTETDKPLSAAQGKALSEAIAQSTAIINTASDGPAKITISSKNSVAGIRIEPITGICSLASPGVEIDIQGADGRIVIYTNTGNGYEYKHAMP